MIHGLRELDDIDELHAPGGALEAFVAAKEAGLVKHLGVSGYEDPDVLLAALAALPVEVVGLPVYPGAPEGFAARVLPQARALGLGVVGLRPLDGGRLASSAQAALQHAFALPVDVVVASCAGPSELAELAARA